MKSLKFILFFFLIAFASCKKGQEGQVSQLSLIPNTASFVMEIDGRDILKKSGLDKPDDYKFMAMLKLMGGDIYSIFESLLKGSKDAGVSIDNICIYADVPRFAVSFQMLDEKAFENNLKKGGYPEPQEGKSYRYVLHGNSYIAWNSQMLILTPNDSRENIAEIFKPKADGLLATNSDFQAFVKNKSDVRMWIKYGGFVKYVQSVFGFGEFSWLSDFEDVLVHWYTDSKDGQINGSMKVYPAEVVNKLKEKYPIMKSFDNSLLKDMPEQSFLAFNAAINVQEYFKIVKENMASMVDGVNSSMNDSYYQELLAEKYEELAEILETPEVKKVVDALAGDILFSIHGFNKGLLTYPLMSMNFSVKGESAFKDILSLMPSSLYKFTDGYYTSYLGKFIPVYFAYKDNKVFVSSDLEAIQNFVAGGKGKNFSQNPVSKAMSDKWIVYMNMDFESYPENIRLLLQNYMGPSFSMFSPIIDIYSSMQFSADENYNVDFTMQFKNSNVNALKQILKSIDKVASSSWSF